jgi:hypothetical protein|tara:strand:- start:88 stop:297 length:210 start_codon:yes stop_codon:yes gene_type:complete
MNKIKKVLITVTALIPLVFAASGPANAFTWGSYTPNGYGGYNWSQFGDGGYQWGSINRSYGGGYNYSYF